VKKFITIVLPLLTYLLLSSGCSEKEESEKFVSLRVGVDLIDRVLQSNVKYSDISTIKLSVLDSRDVYLSDGVLQNEFGSWGIDVNNLPVNRTIQFIAEAFNSDDDLILRGEVEEKITINTAEILVPLQLTEEVEVVSLPTVSYISTGEVNSNRTTITFTVKNSKRDDINWSIIPDEALLQNGISFDMLSGDLSFSGSEEVEFTVMVNGDLAGRSYSNKIELTNSDGDRFGEEFTIFSKRDSISVSVAPIVDNIFLYMQSGILYAEAIVDSTLGSIQYNWSLERESLPVVNQFSKTVSIPDFNGTLKDTFILKVTNSYGISTRYRYIVDLQDIPIIETTNKVDPEQCTQTIIVQNPIVQQPSDDPEVPIVESLIDEDDYLFDLKYTADRFGDNSYSKTLDLAFGESVEVEINTTRIFEEEFIEEFFGENNIDYINFTLQKTKLTSSGIESYLFNITPAQTREGSTYFKFFVKNRYRSEYVEMTVNSRDITRVVDLKERYIVYRDSNRTIDIVFKNERGHPLQFDVNGSGLQYSDISVDGSSLFTTGTEAGATFKLQVDGNIIGEEFLDINVTDMELGYSKIHKIVIEVVERSATNLVDDLYECGNGIDLNDYEVTRATYGGGFVMSNGGRAEIRSDNDIPTRTDLSSVVIFTQHSPNTTSTGLVGNSYLYLQTIPFKQIGEVRFNDSLQNSEFFVKYYDENINRVVCEKHRFPILSGLQF
jgi:hypothetical protein